MELFLSLYWLLLVLMCLGLLLPPESRRVVEPRRFYGALFGLGALGCALLMFAAVPLSDDPQDHLDFIQNTHPFFRKALLKSGSAQAAPAGVPALVLEASRTSLVPPDSAVIRQASAPEDTQHSGHFAGVLRPRSPPSS